MCYTIQIWHKKLQVNDITIIEQQAMLWTLQFRELKFSARFRVIPEYTSGLIVNARRGACIIWIARVIVPGKIINMWYGLYLNLKLN